MFVLSRQSVYDPLLAQFQPMEISSDFEFLRQSEKNENSSAIAALNPLSFLELLPKDQPPAFSGNSAVH